MALIQCPDCGKMFSDRAAACPNCGCPTSEILKESAPGIGSAEAEKQILALVDQTLGKLRAAEDRFRIASAQAENFADHTTVNLFSDSASRKVSEIVERTENASADFYQACQSLIPILDGGCRPLLSQKPGAKAVKAVAGTIALINEKSAIKKDYAVNFNGTDLGKAARSGYTPLPLSLAIQGNWEAEYEKLPGNAEAERFWSEKRAAYVAAGGNKTKKQLINDGYKADIVLYDMNRAEWCPRHDLVSLLVYSASSSSVDAVICDGKVIMEKGEVLTLDEERILHEAQETAMDLVSR